MCEGFFSCCVDCCCCRRNFIALVSFSPLLLCVIHTAVNYLFCIFNGIECCNICPSPVLPTKGTVMSIFHRVPLARSNQLLAIYFSRVSSCWFKKLIWWLFLFKWHSKLRLTAQDGVSAREGEIIYFNQLFRQFNVMCTEAHVGQYYYQFDFFLCKLIYKWTGGISKQNCARTIWSMQFLSYHKMWWNSIELTTKWSVALRYWKMSSLVRTVDFDSDNVFVATSKFHK